MAGTKLSPKLGPTGYGREAQSKFGKSRGWRRSKVRGTCLHRLADERCLASTQQRCPGCDAANQFHDLLDHTQVWLTNDGERVMISEPYNMRSTYKQNLLAEFAETAKTFGLVVEERPDLSVWYPPGTSLLAISRAVYPVALDPPPSPASGYPWAPRRTAPPRTPSG